MVGVPSSTYYGDDLALVHHLGFGFHAEDCAPGILALLEPVRRARGLVLELGCGSGLLTRHLVEAGLRVVATDASDAMLALARQHVAGAEAIERLVLPDDPLPDADAVVSVGHVLSYLDDEASLQRALVAAAGALRPGGTFVVDLCDLAWGRARLNQPPKVWRGDGWFLVTEFSLPSPDRYVREMTTFVRSPDGSWRRDDELHHNVLVDTKTIPVLLARHGVDAEVRASFGEEELPAGLVAIVGTAS